MSAFHTTGGAVSAAGDLSYPDPAGQPWVPDPALHCLHPRSERATITGSSGWDDAHRITMHVLFNEYEFSDDESMEIFHRRTGLRAAGRNYSYGQIVTDHYAPRWAAGRRAVAWRTIDRPNARNTTPYTPLELAAFATERINIENEAAQLHTAAGGGFVIRRQTGKSLFGVQINRMHPPVALATQIAALPPAAAPAVATRPRNPLLAPAPAAIQPQLHQPRPAPLSASSPTTGLQQPRSIPSYTNPGQVRSTAISGAISFPPRPAMVPQPPFLPSKNLPPVMTMFGEWPGPFANLSHDPYQERPSQALPDTKKRTHTGVEDPNEIFAHKDKRAKTHHTNSLSDAESKHEPVSRNNPPGTPAEYRDSSNSSQNVNVSGAANVTGNRPEGTILMATEDAESEAEEEAGELVPRGGTTSSAGPGDVLPRKEHE